MHSEASSDSMNPNPIPDRFGAKVSIELVEKTARELMHRAAISIPEDFRMGVAEMAAQETNPLSKYVLEEIGLNYEVAAEDQRPMCGDTGLPRYYIKAGDAFDVLVDFTPFQGMRPDVREFFSPGIFWDKLGDYSPVMVKEGFHIHGQVPDHRKVGKRFKGQSGF